MTWFMEKRMEWIDRLVVSPVEQRARFLAARARLFPPPMPTAEPWPIAPAVVEEIEPQPEPEPEPRDGPPIVFACDEDRIRWMLQEYRAVKDTGWARLRSIRTIGARAFGVSVSDLLSPRRDHLIVHSRMKIMTFAKLVTGRTWPEVGRAFHRDRTTVIHAVDRFGAIVERVLREEGWPT